MRNISEIVEEAAQALGYRCGQMVQDIFHSSIINVPLPNVPDILTKGYEKAGDSDLYLPPSMIESAASLFNPSGWVSYKFSYALTSPISLVRKDIKPDSKEFELDMMEALVGWRQWYLMEGTLRSLNDNSIQWLPDTRFEAKCSQGYGHATPTEFCSCGIYAKVKKEKYQPEDGELILIWGQIYGWGRYVLGEEAQRTQFAYPKAFYLQESQVDPDTMAALQKYHVPIYVNQPMMVYNPKEDGYEYRNDEENGNFGSNQESDADEDSSTD